MRSFWAWALRGGCILGHAKDPMLKLDSQGRAYWECRRCLEKVRYVLEEEGNAYDLGTHPEKSREAPL